MNILDPALVAAVKRFEGFSARPYWDYRQYTSGYGTRAGGPNEIIDQPTADARLQDALSGAARQVDAQFPNLPAGARNALISLTYNAGPGWMTSDLGNAVRTGDYGRAQQLLQQYNHAGGQVNAGLTNRRATEASWFDQTPPVPPMPIPNVSPQALPSPAAAYATPDLPLFAPQASAPQPTPQSLFSYLAPGSPQEANWFNFQAPLG